MRMPTVIHWTTFSSTFPWSASIYPGAINWPSALQGLGNPLSDSSGIVCYTRPESNFFSLYISSLFLAALWQESPSPKRRKKYILWLWSLSGHLQAVSSWSTIWIPQCFCPVDEALNPKCHSDATLRFPHSSRRSIADHCRLFYRMMVLHLVDLGRGEVPSRIAWQCKPEQPFEEQSSSVGNSGQ